MKYLIEEGWVGRKPYVMVFRTYKPQKISNESVVVLVSGGGHRMKVWEKTPDGRRGWAPLLAEAGREVIVLEWACNSPCRRYTFVIVNFYAHEKGGARDV